APRGLRGPAAAPGTGCAGGVRRTCPPRPAAAAPAPPGGAALPGARFRAARVDRRCGVGGDARTGRRERGALGAAGWGSGCGLTEGPPDRVRTSHQVLELP